MTLTKPKHLGAYHISPGIVEFNVWAPKASTVAVLLRDNEEEISYPMHSNGNGYFTCTLEHISERAKYYYLLNGKTMRPDPASCWQPDGVHGPSRVYNTKTFQWTDSKWHGIPLSDYIIYELHIGTFTPEGTFKTAIDKVPYLQDLGITAIELMPIIEFSGVRNWGYDGVFPYAPHHSYGNPDDLKALVNACHNAGIAVILDVVYNHLGPEGNYLEDFGFYFTDRYKTPWGLAVNYDGPHSDEVRRYFVDNSLYWQREFHIDALRLDAVHAIFDSSPTHILKTLKEAFLKQACLLGKAAYLIMKVI